MSKFLDNITDEKTRKVYLIKFFVFAALFSLTVFSIKFLLQKEYSKVIVLSTFFVITLTNLIVFYLKKNISFASFFTVVLFFIFELVLYVFVPSNGYAILWIYIFPPVAVLLVGDRKGRYFSLALILSVIFLFIFLRDKLDSAYTGELLFRIVFTYAILVFMIYVFEYSRKKLQKLMDDKNIQLKDKNDELKATEEELKQSNEELLTSNEITKANEQRLTKLIQNLGDGFVIFNLDGEFTFVNDAAARMYGVKPEELMGNKFGTFFSEKDLENIENAIKKVIIGKIEKVEVEAHNKENEKIYILATMYAEYDSSNEVSGIIALFKDITELKQNEIDLKAFADELTASGEELYENNEELKILNEKIKEKEQRISSIIKNLSDGLLIFDNEGIINYANEVASNILGVGDSKELLSKNIFAYILNDKNSGYIKDKLKNVALGKIEHLELKLNVRENEINISASLSLNYNSNNDPIGYLTVFKDITEQKKEHERVIQLNKQLKKLYVAFDQSPVATVIFSYKGKIEYVNPALEKITGYTRDEVLGLHYGELGSKLTPPEERKKTWEQILAGKSVVKEFENFRKDGTSFVERALVTPVRDETGKIINFIALKEDITELKQAQQKVEEQIEQQRRLIDNLPAHIFFKDKDLRYVLVNKSYSDLLGKKTEDMVGKRYSEVFGGEKGEEFEAIDRKIIETGEAIHNLENVNIDVHGNKHWVSVSKVPYFDSEGKPAGVVGIIQDITEKKIKEQKIIALNNELHRYFAAIEQSPVGIVFLNEEGQRQYVNDSYSKITGYKKEDVIGVKSSIFEDKNRGILDRLKQEKVIQLEYERKANRTFFERLFISAITDENDKIIQYVVLIEDITKEKKQQEIILSQHDSLRKANEHINESINYAKIIQSSLMQQDVVINKFFKEHFVVFRPKEKISGDFYFFNKINNYLVFAVADCTGHGIPGAFISILGYSMLQEIVIHEEVKTVGQALNLLRDRVKRIFKTFHGGMDMALCALDIQSKKLQFAGANSSVIIIRDDKLTEYKGTSNPIGSYPIEKDFETKIIDLNEDDSIFLFSDGFVDQFGIDASGLQRKFMRKYFKKLLFEIRDKSLAEQKEILLDTLHSWQQGVPQTDDITVWGLRI